VEQKPCVIFTLGPVDILSSSFAYYTIAFSVLCQALVFVSVGAMADYGPYRKRMLIISTVAGSVAAMLMATVVRPSLYWYAVILTIVMNVAFGTATVFYNAYLPILAKNYKADDLEEEIPTEMADVVKAVDEGEDGLEKGGSPPAPSLAAKNVSSESLTGSLMRLRKLVNVSSYISTRGFILGYVAAFIVLILSAAFVYLRKQSMFNLQLCVAFCGLWWLLFSVFPLWTLRTRPGPRLPRGTNYLLFSWKKVAQTVKKCGELPVTFWYLLSFFLFSDGYSTMGAVAVIFARTEMNVPYDKLIIAVLISPFASIAGNYAFFQLQNLTKISSKAVLIILLGLMGLVPCWGVLGLLTDRFGLHQQWEIYLFASYYGFLVGALQSFSRVIFSDLIPAGDESEFFSLYAITDKGSSWVGPLLQSLIGDLSGLPRAGLLVLIVMIWAPIPILIWLVDMKRGFEDAKLYHHRQPQHDVAFELQPMAEKPAQ
jgi:UMF1 family MFS transporter